MIQISFVIPCYRSANTIIQVLKEIEDKMNERPDTIYEVITVNDSSPDNVLQVLKEYAETHSWLRVVDFTKNFGQHAAMMAGLSFASGKYIVFLDDDFQCPVDRIWDLLAPLDEGYDISVAQYKFEERKESFFRVLGSRINDAMMCTLIDKPKDLRITNFVAMKDYIANEVLEYKNPYPYIDGLLLRSSHHIASVPMQDRERLSGSSNYNLRKLISLFSNGFTAFSILPLRIATFSGTICSILGFCWGIYLIIHKLIHPQLITEGYMFFDGCASVHRWYVYMIMLVNLRRIILAGFISVLTQSQYVIRSTYPYDCGE